MAAMNLDGPSHLPDFGPVYESDIEAELEVDQLDSDSDNDDAVDPTNPNSKNGTGRAGERVPGHTLLSAVRIENMIQADGVTGNLALSKEGLFLLSIATEEFIKRLIQAGHREASAHQRNTINYKDMSVTTQQYQEFLFLIDTIPTCITLADALQLRQRREIRMLEGIPAAGPSLLMTSAPSPDSDISTSDPYPKDFKAQYEKLEERTLKNQKLEKEAREKANGSISTGSLDHRVSKMPTNPGHQIQDVDKDWDMDPASHGGESSSHPKPIHNGISSASSIPPLINGHSSGISRSLTPPLIQNGSEHGANPLQSRHPDSHSHSRSPSPPFHAHNDPAWTGQFTGPASGFLQGSVPFGRANRNPGRTIYSQSTSQRPE